MAAERVVLQLGEAIALLQAGQETSNRNIQTLGEQIVQQQQAVAMALAGLGESSGALRDAARAQIKEHKKSSSLVDRQGIGKPGIFSGKDHDWTGWSYKFSTWVSSQVPRGDEILDWAAAERDSPITVDTLVEVRESFPEIDELNQQLHAILVSMTTMGTTAFELVKNT